MIVNLTHFQDKANFRIKDLYILLVYEKKKERH